MLVRDRLCTFIELRDPGNLNLRVNKACTQVCKYVAIFFEALCTQEQGLLLLLLLLILFIGHILAFCRHHSDEHWTKNIQGEYREEGVAFLLYSLQCCPFLYNFNLCDCLYPSLGIRFKWEKPANSRCKEEPSEQEREDDSGHCQLQQ